MKRSFKEHIRWRIVVILSILLVLSLGMTLWCFSQPLQLEKDVPVYKYTQQAQVNYLVHFKANKFFDERTAGPGRAYITSLTDYIETQLVCQLNGDSPASVHGNIEVVAVLTGYILQEKSGSQAGEKEKVKIWEKVTPLLEPTPYVNDKAKTETIKVIPVNLAQFKNFADQVNTELKSPAELVELAVIYNVTADVSNDQGTSTSKVSPQLVIPIKGNTFVVGGALTDKKEQAINSKQTVDVPGANGSRKLAAVVTIFLVLLLLLVIYGSTIEEEDPFEKALRQIMKKHGDRIVAARGLIPHVFDGNLVSLESLEELVKVADELGQPILYENIQTDMHSFYVVHEPLIYNYRLSPEIFHKERPKADY